MRMANNYFAFRQFTIWQTRAAMKVGTDGVLLGAWATAGDVQRVLDIGTGTGLIALMLAQRTPAQVDAVELEPEAARQAQENFAKAPWTERLHLYKQDIQDFAQPHTARYDLIVSNPPFFVNSLKPQAKTRSMARHHESMRHEDLIRAAGQLLNARGRFALILPYAQEGEFTTKALFQGLYPVRRTVVYPREGKPPHRCLLEMARERLAQETEALTLRTRTGAYTEEYRALTADFYLK